MRVRKRKGDNAQVVLGCPVKPYPHLRGFPCAMQENSAKLVHLERLITMLKLKIEEAPVGSIIWRANLTPGQDVQAAWSFTGAIDADTIDEEEFVQALWNEIHFVGKVSITLTNGKGESVPFVAHGDDTGAYGIDMDSPDCDIAEFVVGRYAEAIRTMEVQY